MAIPEAIELSDLAADTTPLYYLKRFTASERKAFTDQYSLSESFLEALLQNHRKQLYAYYSNYMIALWMSQLFVVFQTTTSFEGISKVADLIEPGTEVSQEANYALGIPMAVASSIFFLMIYSPYKYAVQSTLDYATRQSLKARLQQLNCKDSLKWLGHQSVILTANLTGGSSYVIELNSELQKWNPILKTTTSAGVIYFAHAGYSCYMTEEYYKGAAFWQDKKYPWLLSEIAHGRVAVPTQVLLQGLSGVGLRVFPTFYYLAQAANENFGWWPPAPVVAALVGVHSLCVLYPATYKHYYDNKLRVSNDSIQQKMNDARYGYLFRQSPVSILPVAYRGSLGGYFGASVIAPLLLSVIDEPYSINILSIMAGVTLFAGLLYRAERERVAAAEVANTQNLDQVPQHADEQVCQLGAKTSAGIVSVGANVAGVLSTVGVLLRLIGDNSPAIVTVTALIAVERMINLIIFAMPRVTNNFQDGLKATARFFHQQSEGERYSLSELEAGAGSRSSR